MGNLVPNKVAMFDDSTHGDQREGDQVWSYSTELPIGTRVFYLYTNSGEEGKWEGLDIPDVRYVEVITPKNGEVLYTPIDSFGEMHLKSDPWHTTTEGYNIIANALIEKLKKDVKFRSHLAKTQITKN